jgi:hypothetical protein
MTLLKCVGLGAVLPIEKTPVELQSDRVWLWLTCQCEVKSGVGFPAAEAAHAKNSSIMTPEFEFPNSLIGREQFPVRQFHFPVLLRKIPCSTA